MISYNNHTFCVSELKPQVEEDNFQDMYMDEIEGDDEEEDDEPKKPIQTSQPMVSYSVSQIKVIIVLCIQFTIHSTQLDMSHLAIRHVIVPYLS